MTEHPPTTSSRTPYACGRRLGAWLAVALVLGAIVAAGEGPVTEAVWRTGVLVAGVIAAFTARRINRLPLLFALGIVLTAARLSLVGAGDLALAVHDATWAQAGSDVIAAPTLVGMLLFAIRKRRGHLGTRELLDGATVVVGAGLASWIAVANPAWIEGTDLPLAIAAAAYLPIAVMLVTFALELMLENLGRNRAMWLVMASATGNLVAMVVRTLAHTDLLPDTAMRVVPALFVASFLAFCAAVSQRDAPEMLTPLNDTSSRPHREAVRMAPLGLALFCGVALVLTVDATSLTDRIVRAASVSALMLVLIARLYVALDQSARVLDRLERRLNHDELTGLLSRPRFVDQVAKALDATWRSDRRPTLIQINVDRFKNINDTLGHDAANRVLVRVAERLADAGVVFGGEVGRSGGDEFVILDSTSVDEHDALTRVAAIAAELARPVVMGDVSVFVTASIGVVVAPRNRTISAEELMRRADIATHQAKADGRNRVVLFDESMQSSLARRMDVENALHGAIGRREMRLHHQPIVDIVSGRLVGFEALIRWQRSDNTIVSPADFIPIAEETGLINELGAWALTEALIELRRWIDDGVVPPTTTTSVNVSPRQIADPCFAATVRNALETSGMPAHLLWIEMTESMMLEEPDLARTTLREIRSMGVRLALDDFGTGYSSLSLLQEFPIQRIKIDRAFVQGIADHTNDRSLVRTNIAMAHSMGLDLVAEGVETVHQLRALRDLGCEKAQGYLISHPVPPEAMRSTMMALDEFASLSVFTSEDFGRPALADAPVYELAMASPRPIGALSVRPIG